MGKKNILLIFTDMQRADTIGALGNGIIQTPNLDRLVREGTSFTRCYTPSPVCVPARCCMHYGLYPQSTGLFVNGRMMDDNGASLAAILSGNGYHTVSVGKCHFTPDGHARRGFDERVTQEERVTDYSKDDYRKWLVEHGHNPVEAHGERGPMYYIPQPSRFQGAAHPTEWIADRTMEKMRELSGRDRPWCIMSSIIHPHPPLTPPAPWTKLYDPRQIPDPLMPENHEELLTHINLAQNRYKWRDQGLDRNLLRMIRAFYYATISYIDYQVGRMLEQLEQLGILDDTLVIFSSDHGEYLGDYGCYGKRSMHDASARVPLIARLPGRFEAGARCGEPASLVDILPTMAGAAGIPAGEADGIDLAEVACGDAGREHVYSQWGKGKSAIYLIASRDWKYIYSAGERKELLFDRLHDPLETRNAAADSDSREVKESLRAALMAYLDKKGDREAVVDGNGTLEWVEHPPFTRNYLSEDPDAELLFQDEPAGLPGSIGGYTFWKGMEDNESQAAFERRLYHGDS